MAESAVPETNERASPTLKSIQVLRAVAAIGVLTLHAATEKVVHMGGAPGPFKNFLLGAAGVDLFFVISGFVMVYSSQSLFGRADGPRRFLLRRLARRLLPVECVNRSKQGFATPLSSWLDDWPDLVGDLVLGDRLAGRGWFRRDALEALVDGRLAGVNREKLLWTLCVLELWLRSVEEARA